MLRTRRARLVAAVALGAAAALTAFVRTLPLEPHLEIHVYRLRDVNALAIYDLRVRARGGEVLDAVKVEVLRGSVGVAYPQSVSGLAPGSTFGTQVSVTGVSDVPPAVRVVQEGRVARVYDVDLEEWRRR